MNLWLVLLTGLTTDGLSCLSVQGGLLASVIANQKDDEQRTTDDEQARSSGGLLKSQVWLPVGMFLSTKLISHAILGFLLGTLGSVLTLSLGASLMFQFLAGFFMLATALNLLEIHPIFRHVAIKPPYFLQRYIRNSSKRQAIFAPALLGLLSVFIPCGVTQAMEVQAINSGSAWQGALILAVFVIGTMPIFSLIGVATSKLSDLWNRRFLHFTAVVLILMSAYSFNGILQVLDSPITFQKIRDEVVFVFSPAINESQLVESTQGVQQVNIDVLPQGYSPNRVTVRAGQPVEFTLTTNKVYSCATAFTFREFGINVNLKPTDKQTFNFTPTKPGKYTFSCSMGMYSGVMEVI